MFRLRWVLLGLVLAAVFAYGLGYLHWNKDAVQCVTKKHWSRADWKTFYAIGRFEVRYRPINYDCEPEAKCLPGTCKLDPAGAGLGY